MSLATIGARLRNRFTKVGTALYDAGNTSTFKLPQGPLLRTLWLRLSGSLNVTTLGTVLSDAPLGLISKVELVADGGVLVPVAGDPRLEPRADPLGDARRRPGQGRVPEQELLLL